MLKKHLWTWWLEDGWFWRHCPTKNTLNDIKCTYCICLPQVQANHQEPTGTTLQESACKAIIISVLQGLGADIAEIGKLWGPGLWFELRECHIFLETTISRNYLHISVEVCIHVYCLHFCPISKHLSIYIYTYVSVSSFRLYIYMRKSIAHVRVCVYTCICMYIFILVYVGICVFMYVVSLCASALSFPSPHLLGQACQHSPWRLCLPDPWPAVQISTKFHIFRSPQINRKVICNILILLLFSVLSKVLVVLSFGVAFTNSYAHMIQALPHPPERILWNILEYTLEAEGASKAVSFWHQQKGNTANLVSMTIKRL